MLQVVNMYVSAAIIKDQEKYLITKRLLNTHLGGKWEFPGGKIEHGESPQDALVREIQEELDMFIGVSDIAGVYTHKKENLNIIILFFYCYIIKGKPKKIACEDFKWITREEMADMDLAPADAKMCSSLFSKN